MLDGHCTLTAGEASVALEPGGMVPLPHGDAHQVAAADGLDLFCGHCRFDRVGAPQFRLIPPVVHVSPAPPAVHCPPGISRTPVLTSHSRMTAVTTPVI